jgi:hypothetical protein
MAKTTRRQSLLTTVRGATPTTPTLAGNFMNFRFNHLTQRAVRPGRLGSASGWTTPNPDGRPMVSANARTGQSLEHGGMVWTDPGQVKVDQG